MIDIGYLDPVKRAYLGLKEIEKPHIWTWGQKTLYFGRLDSQDRRYLLLVEDAQDLQNLYAQDGKWFCD